MSILKLEIDLPYLGWFMIQWIAVMMTIHHHVLNRKPVHKSTPEYLQFVSSKYFDDCLFASDVNKLPVLSNLFWDVVLCTNLSLPSCHSTIIRDIGH